MTSPRDLLKSGARFLASHRDNAAVDLSIRAARAFLMGAENLLDYDIEHNGEAAVLNRLPTTGPLTVFDVGANVGDWTAPVLAHNPQAAVHCFEIVPATAKMLDARFGSDPRVTVNVFGLLDEPGEVKVRVYPGESTLSSTTSYRHDRPSEEISAEVRTGDDYCREHGIERIDFLKIDAEGADYRVLEGFAGLLATQGIHAVQFEYGKANLSSRTLLADFFELLEQHGYVVGKIYPRQVRFGPYDILAEDFLGPNYLAVLAEDEARWQRLR